MPIKRSQATYTYCYCEENVWKLCEYFQKQGHSLAGLSVAFVSNGNLQSSMCFSYIFQKLSQYPSGGVPTRLHLACGWETKASAGC